MKTNTKEHIKNRMIKNAAVMWGVPANEIETSFDPIIAMLLAACASEIEKVTGEVDASQARITEKVVQLMTPEAMNGPSLAHGILCAEPIDDQTIIQPEFLFNYRKKETYNATSVKLKDLCFSPIQPFNLVNAQVQYMVTADRFTEYKALKNGQHEVTLLQESKLDSATLYLGISSDLKTIPLHDISFYFDVNGVGKQELFYHHLRNTKWSTATENIDFVGGFDAHKAKQNSSLNAIFETVSDKTNTLCQQLINRYESHYITLQDTSKKGMEASDFSELESSLAANDIKVDESIRWLKIEFPKMIPTSVLQQVNCSLNAFPVVNRELKSFSYPIKEFIHILPIKTENLFFDIKSISNTDGKAYKARNKDNSNLDKGTFVVRGNSIAKLDQRKAREYVIHLIELLKDESASFSFLNNDFLRGNLKVLNQVIALLENKVSEASSDMMQTNYIAFKPFSPNENLLVDYWTTNGEAANNIKAGSKLAVYKGYGVQQGTSRLLTSTHGGKDDLNIQDRLNASRRSLLSKDRIVTKEDVKALCFEIYGDTLQSVAIQRGYKNHIDLKKGIVPCIEIALTPNPQQQKDAAAWETMESNLRYYLENKSTNALPYHIKTMHYEY